MAHLSSEHLLRKAGRLLAAGGVIAHPTEGVYGLACDPFDPDAVERLLTLKGRDIGAGFIVLAAHAEEVASLLGDLPAARWREISGQWPGPVTWVLPAADWVPDWITGGRDTLAVRVTAFAPSARLCELAGGLLISTSANPSGCKPARSALRARVYFPSGIDMIIGGPTGGRDRPTPMRHALGGHTLRD
ncbi:MAG: Sua5/YciO/YrdC/YwlC family protein [Gammaproteobacteria bacterium]|nr:Sua5/YciO/YrdC/YwlC family protein [Gammaproteobacteria bacterium]